MSIWKHISQAIEQATGESFHSEHHSSCGGGSINSAYKISNDSHSYFVKLNHGSLLDMFEAEAAGLNEIASSQSIRVPQVICYGTAEGQAYLVLEHIRFGRGNNNSHQQLGHDLAQMHQHTQAQFGWFRDNTIGSTPQPNTLTADWVTFLRDQRIGFQLQLAARNGYRGQLQSQGQALLDVIDQFFSNYQPQPSLLHGDLWSGNYAISDAGEPLIFDPATYYGDREADLAMTELFGGFPPDFYSAYNDAYPLDSGYKQRKTLYNLYHIINHLNLFGGGYLSQAESMMARLLSEVR